MFCVQTVTDSRDPEAYKIADNSVKKEVKAHYLGLTTTSTGTDPGKNIERVRKAGTMMNVLKGEGLYSGEIN